MDFDPTDAIRYAIDYGANATVGILGMDRYATFLVQAPSPAIDLASLSNPVQELTSTRITVADGYRPWIAPGDGYLYPLVKEITTTEPLASGGVLSVRQVKMGPLVFPYLWNSPFSYDGIAGGIDPSFFTPLSNYWIKIVGEGIIGGHGNGCFYEIKQIELTSMKNITYYLILQSTSSQPGGQ